MRKSSSIFIGEQFKRLSSSLRFTSRRSSRSNSVNPVHGTKSKANGSIISTATLNFYQLVCSWAKHAAPLELQFFSVPDLVDAEQMAYTFHLKFNNNMRFEYDVTYVCSLRTIIIRRLSEPRTQHLPEMKIVGKTHIIE